MLRDLNLNEFAERLASEDPAPGGGSASAAVAALGAGLLVMTCKFTVGRPEHAEVEGELREVLDELEPLRIWFLTSIDRDAEAYGRVVLALGMPKGTPRKKAVRREAIQDAMRGAAEVPMDVARRCVRALDLAAVVAELGNPNTISDTGCGARFLEAGLRGALYNVRINLGSIKDGGYVGSMSAEVDAIEERASSALSRVEVIVDSKL
jgi:formiminotetrahydrofolate cyclodeaminase